MEAAKGWEMDMFGKLSRGSFTYVKISPVGHCFGQKFQQGHRLSQPINSHEPWDPVAKQGQWG